MLKAGIIPGLFISAAGKKNRPRAGFYVEDIALVGGFRFVLLRALEIVGQRILRAVQRHCHLATMTSEPNSSSFASGFFRLS